MAVLRMEAFAQYEGDVSQLTQSDNGWAAFPTSGALVVGGGRAGGDRYENQGGSNDVAFNNGLRNALPAAANEAWVHFGYLTPQYPSDQRLQGLLHAWTIAGSSGLVFAAYVNPAGAIEVYNSAGTLLGTTANGVIATGAQHAVAIHFIRHASTGVVQIWVDSVEKLNLTGLNLGATDVSLVTFIRNVQSGGFPYLTQLFDVFVTDEVDDGAGNDGFMGDPRLSFLRARRDYDPAQGWTPQRRQMFGTGTLFLQDVGNRDDAVTAADASAMRVGAGDFTAEGHFRFLELPSGSNKATFFGKWLETGNVRSWQLFYGGPSLNSNRIEARVSTDGTAATVSSPISVSWTPVIGRRYHIALQVESGLATLYIDGIRQNAPQAWPTPADNTALFALGSQQESSIPAFVNNTGFVGFNDEFRFTKGVARYGSGFAVPTQAFPRNAIDDPDYSSVVWLSGWDSAILDESSAPRTLTARGTAVRYAPDDAPPGNFKVILHGDRDDSYIEAPFTAAEAILTFTINPSDGDTVDADGETYTFVTPFVDVAGNVLIDATIDDSINNLAAAMNSDAGEGTLYGTATAPLTNASAANRGLDQLLVTADALGTAGNAIVVDSSNASNVWSSATLTGGADIPDPSEFVLERLPAHTVTVLAAALIHRSKKTDSGAASVQPAFITSDGSSENGDEVPLTTNFVFYNSIIVIDPSTMGGLTPTSFINARIRIDRTE